MKSILGTLVNGFVRSIGWNLGKKVTNHGDTRWECESCGSVKPKVAQKFYTTDGVVCRKCNKGV